MIAETVSDIFTDFQNSLRYTELCTNSRQAASVNPCFPGKSE
jgi:hypothetical protein